MNKLIAMAASDLNGNHESDKVLQTKICTKCLIMLLWQKKAMKI
ncbi:MAG: hypothetical protein ACLR43_00085 [Faecalibacillus faecis]